MPHTTKPFAKPLAARGKSRIALMAGAVLATIALAACEITPAPDGRFMSRTQTPVYPITDTTFEVGLRPGQPFRAFWCSAADYARRELGADWNDRIYVLRGLGNGRISGAPDAVEFSLDPVDQAAQPSLRLSSNAFTVGQSRTVNSANGDCHRLFRDDFDE